MARSPDCPQNQWQEKFKEYDLAPFTEGKRGLQYHDLNDPKFWWHNPLNHKSLRLTSTAFKMLEKAKIKSYKFDLKQKYLTRTFVQLEKHFTSPYFLSNSKRIYIFGETEMMMLALHGNDLQTYLDNQDS
jgi:hypothetical protein